MTQIRKILAVLSAVLIVLIIIYMNHDDFSWQANKNSYLGLMACVLNIWALVFLIKDKKS
jgi:hypothetical membrane protein